MDGSQREELLDRLMHQTLEEKLGAARPSDAADELASVKPRPSKPLLARTWFRVAIATSALFAITVGVLSNIQVAQFRSLTSAFSSKDAKRDERSREGRARTSVTMSETTDGDIETDEASPASVLPRTEVVTAKSPAASDDVTADLYVADSMKSDVLADEFAPAPANDRASLVPPRKFDLSKGKASENKSPSFGAGLGDRRGERRLSPDANQRPANAPKSNDEKPSPFYYQDDVGYHAPHGESRNTFDVQGRDRFARLNDNRFLAANDNPLSTFSIDVDTASYSVIRSRIEARQAPPPAAVRVEELINYFSYNYPQPTDGAPFAVHVDVAACPWATKHRLVRIGLKGREIAKADRPASNLVFLVDVSGSMQPQNKLPLVRQGLLRLVGELDERDRVAIVVYAGSSGCVLASTPCTQSNKERIRSAIAALESGGSTNGEAGIQLAYQIAQDHFVKGGANRVILCTDGDFNVGTTGDESLKRLVAERAKSGVFLTALGFGMGNHNDQMLEAIADNGNGTYGYIDDEREVEKLFVRQLSGTLITIAKDVKIQVEFNPAQVGAYRLIGYENRILAHENFNNDKKDAGDIGAGHTVTALYEIVPPAALAEAQKTNAAASEGASNAAAGSNGNASGNVDALEFQRPKQELELTDAAKTSGDLLLVKLRYKAPDGDTSTLIRTPAKDAGTTFAAANSDFKFAASVAGFGMFLRQSPFRGDITLAAVEEIAQANLGEDHDGQRKEFVNLVRQVRTMTTESREARE
jgi:Ca-activated chloride channel homolog